MGTHLYVCENGGPLVIATEGTPPPWITCPVCAANECGRCDGAKLQGLAEEFARGTSAVFRCSVGHEKEIRVPGGVRLPESAQCVECDAMMLPIASSQ